MLVCEGANNSVHFELWRCYRLRDLMVKRMELDDAMNMLSTLGGAYSALGDYFVYHVCMLLFAFLADFMYVALFWLRCQL